MNWLEYQENVADVFRRLGCKASVEESVNGARGTHSIDVLVTFDVFGIETIWIVECKLWKRPVPKEKVLALTSIVQDIGADKGIIMSESGFQSGAIVQATHSNIRLTDLKGLSELTESDFNYIILDKMMTRVTRLFNMIMALSSTTKTAENLTVTTFRDGIDGRIIMNAMSTLAMIKSGLDNARQNQPPYPVAWDEAKARFISVPNISDFRDRATELLDSIEVSLISETRRQENI